MAESNSRPAVWVCALAAIAPVALVLTIILLRFDAGPTAFLPLWSDEVVYWNEATTFAEAGFKGGYVTVHEQPAAAEFSRFGPHGPVFAIVQGTIGAIAGWRPHSGFLFNIVIVSMAAFAWFRAGRAGVSPASVALVLGFWPLLLYLPTHMQEPTHFALAFLFALAIDHGRRAHRTPSGLAATALLLAVASLLRPTWALMILPLGWRTARRRGPGAVLGLLVVAMIAAAGAYRTFDVLGSPGYPNSLHHISETWAESPSRAVGAILELSTANLSKLLAWSTDAPPQVVLRYFLVLFIAVLGVRVLVARPREQACADAMELACVTVAPLFAITLLVGEVESWRDFRLLSPALLVALLLLVPHCRWERWLWSLTLVLTPLYWAGFAEFHRDRFTTRDVAITTMRDATRTLRFVRDASPWDNTVLVHADLLQFPLLGLPSGIAVSYVTNWDDLASPIRSRFLLLRHDDREQIESRIRLAPVAETPLGTLYTNLGTAEPRPAS